MLHPKLYPLERMLAEFLNKEELKRVFEMASENNQVLWSYEGMDMQTDFKEIKSTDKNLFIFCYDMGVDSCVKEYHCLFTDKNLKQFVNNKNPDVITFYVEEDAIPMFKLKNMAEYAKIFNTKNDDEAFNFYTDNRIYKLGHVIQPAKSNDMD